MLSIDDRNNDDSGEKQGNSQETKLKDICNVVKCTPDINTHSSVISVELLKRLLQEDDGYDIMVLFKLISSSPFQLVNDTNESIDLNNRDVVIHHFDREYLKSLCILLISCCLYKTLCIVDYLELRTLMSYFPDCYSDLYLIREKQCIYDCNINSSLVELIIDDLKDYFESYHQVMINSKYDMYFTNAKYEMYFTGIDEFFERFDTLKSIHHDRINTVSNSPTSTPPIYIPGVIKIPNKQEVVISPINSNVTLLKTILLFPFIANYTNLEQLTQLLSNSSVEELLSLIHIFQDLSVIYNFALQVTCLIDILLKFECCNLLNLLKWNKKITKLKTNPSISMEPSDLNIVKRLNKDDKVFFIDTVNGDPDKSYISDGTLLYLDYLQSRLDSLVSTFEESFSSLKSISPSLSKYSGHLKAMLNDMKNINYKLVHDYMIKKLIKYVEYSSMLSRILTN